MKQYASLVSMNSPGTLGLKIEQIDNKLFSFFSVSILH